MAERQVVLASVPAGVLVRLSQAFGIRIHEIQTMNGADELVRAFGVRFGGEPTHRSRAPGRVNLIGEHTDYNDLPVLPMALQRRVDIVLRPREDDRVRIVNVDPGFEPVDFRIGADIAPGPPGHWENYVKAPAQHLARRFGVGRGFEGVLASDVPIASGLSSSAALVCAVGLALARLGEVTIDARSLADEMAEAERYVGTRGGGMDQAISLTALAGHASRIDFAPLRLRPIPVPPQWRFVVADTLTRAEKSGAARHAYNERTVECREARESVARELVRRGLVSTAPPGYPELRDSVGWTEALAAGSAVLDERLLRRFRHVVTEARRVEEAEHAIESGDAEAFGALMDASHESLRVDYEVSSAELDQLVDAARTAGAMGARLTGAGFGGCIVALSDASAAEDVVRALEREYYQERSFTGRLADRLFVARPSEGASFGAI